MSDSKFQLILFSFLLLFLYLIPDTIQLPFRILFLVGANFYLVAVSKSFTLDIILFLIVSIIFYYFKVQLKTFDTSLLMVLLSVFPVLYFNKFEINALAEQKNTLILICCLCIVGIVTQMAIFRYNGRPTLSYEINQSGSYLFLFFLFCDVLKFRIGKVLVLIASFFLLSRLLLLGIFVFYIIRFLKKPFRIFFKRFSFGFIFLLLNSFILIFSFWFLVNLSDEVVDSGEDATRLVNVVDGSNYVRFKTNVKIMEALAEKDKVLLYSGYGDLAVSNKYIDKYGIMPHNELLKAVAQFGLVFTLLLFLISFKNWRLLTQYGTMEYVIPIVLYTIILWVRFTIVPSIEMIFILSILSLKLYYDRTEKKAIIYNY